MKHESGLGLFSSPFLQFNIVVVVVVIVVAVPVVVVAVGVVVGTGRSFRFFVLAPKAARIGDVLRLCTPLQRSRAEEDH